MINAAKKTLEEAGEHATDDECSSIEAAISEAEEALKSDDKDTIEAVTTKPPKRQAALLKRCMHRPKPVRHQASRRT